MIPPYEKCIYMPRKETGRMCIQMLVLSNSECWAFEYFLFFLIFFYTSQSFYHKHLL